MFYTHCQRSFCRPCKGSIKLPSLSKINVPVFVKMEKGSQSAYFKFGGKIGRDGFSFVCPVEAAVGKNVTVRIVLIGAGVVVETVGKVVKVNKVKDGFEIICFFEQSTAEIRQTIVNYIASLSHRMLGVA